MANPLFVPDFDTLRRELRLSGVKVTEDADDIIRRATLEVRMRIAERVPASIITTILATTYKPTPDVSSEAEMKRALAYLLEVKWVRLVLMRTLPSMFMDNSGGITEAWNEEGAFRKRLTEDLEREARDCQVSIETWLEILNGEQTFGNVSVARIFSTRRQDPHTTPTGSLSGGNDALFGDFRKVDAETPGVD